MRQKLRGFSLTPLFLLAVFALLVGCSGGVQQGSWFGLAASEDTVYFAADEAVVALDLVSGAELWGYPVEPDRQEFGPFYATPLVDKSFVNLAGYGDGEVYALIRDRGTEQWTAETGAGIVEGPAPVGDSIVVGNNDGAVYVIDQETQDRRLLMQATEAIWATPRVDETNDRVFVATMDHNLYAVELSTGEQIWTFDAGGALVGTPALSDGVVYAGTLTSKFYAIDADTGGELWRVETDGWIWGGPLVDGDTVYFGDLDGKLHALDATDGSERWSFDAEGGVRGTPVLVDDVIYFGTRDGYVYALSTADGSQEWVQTLSGAIYTAPVISGDYLLISLHGAKVKLVALDPESGAERWSYPPQEE